MIENLAVLIFGFICGAITCFALVTTQHRKNEELKRKIKQEIDRLHK